MDSARTLSAECRHSADEPVVLAVSSGKAKAHEPQNRGDLTSDVVAWTPISHIGTKLWRITDTLSWMSRRSIGHERDDSEFESIDLGAESFDTPQAMVSEIASDEHDSIASCAFGCFNSGSF